MLNNQQPSAAHLMSGVGGGPAGGTLLGSVASEAWGQPGLGMQGSLGHGQSQQPQLIQKLPHMDEDKIYRLMVDLLSPEKREQALLELSKKREQYDDLALILWHSFGVMSALLQEIISVYPALSPATLTGHASNRVCNALALLQCVASHNETRGLFLTGTSVYPYIHCS